MIETARSKLAFQTKIYENESYSHELKAPAKFIVKKKTRKGHAPCKISTKVNCRCSYATRPWKCTVNINFSAEQRNFCLSLFAIQWAKNVPNDRFLSAAHWMCCVCTRRTHIAYEIHCLFIFCMFHHSRILLSIDWAWACHDI